MAIDLDDDPATGGGEWPGFGGVASAGWDVLYVLDEADTLANLIGGSVPVPTGGDRWRIQAVAAQADGPHPTRQVMNVAFRGPDEQAKFTFVETSPPGDGAWFEDNQAAALADGDISAFGVTVDVADLQPGGATRQIDEVGPGLHERVYTSDVTLPPGEGMSYTSILGRGGGGTTGAFGQEFHYFGRYQPYGIYIPSGEPPYQLGMIYHGSNQNHSQQINLPGIQQQIAEGPNRLLAAPLARGVHGYGSDISERDLEDVEADVRANYPIDPTRTLAAGYSQGGYVTFRQAALHPDRFSSVISWVGFTGDASNPAPTDEVTAGAVGNMFDFVRNYSEIPAALIYGGADELVHPTSSGAMAQEFRTHGNVYEYFLHPTADHFTFLLLDEWQKEADYTTDRVTTADPARVVFRSGEVLGDPDHGIRHDEAYWVSQLRGRERVDDPFRAEEAYIDVDLESPACEGATRRQVEATNDAGEAPVPWVSDGNVQVGETPLQQRPLLSGALTNVDSLAVDTARTCLTGALAYAITSDGPATVRLSDGRRITLVDGENEGEVPAPTRGAAVTDRIAGAGRVATAVEVLARADDYADALGAGPLAALLDAPLLLTDADSLDPAVAAEVTRLGADAAVLAGGTAALSAQVEQDLLAAGVQTRRIAGADRFDTAALMADEIVAAGGDGSRAYLVEGAHADPARGWPDAVRAGALAARLGRPILLATHDQIPAATLDALARLGTTAVTVVGGEAAIPWRTLAMAADPDRDGVGQVALDRIAGASRYETSALVADRMLDHLATTEQVWQVTGTAGPAARAAGPAAAASGGVLLLVDGAVVGGGPTAQAWRDAHAPIERSVLVGGQAVLLG